MQTKIQFPHRPIRSFVRREGRMTKSQQQAFEQLWPAYGLTLDTGLLQFDSIFDRHAMTVLEIGFGMGQSLLEQAQQNPDKNYLGIEVHRPGIGALLAGIEKLQLKNIRVFGEDALEVLKQCISNDSLDEIQIFFPDPWPKTRHHKRRLIQPEFVALIHSKLKSQGKLYLATDWENYADHMLSVMEHASGWNNMAGKNNFSPRLQQRPLTKFEKRGQKLGHGVWDLVFTKTTP